MRGQNERALNLGFLQKRAELDATLDSNPKLGTNEPLTFISPTGGPFFSFCLLGMDKNMHWSKFSVTSKVELRLVKIYLPHDGWILNRI